MLAVQPTKPVTIGDRGDGVQNSQAGPRSPEEPTASPFQGLASLGLHPLAVKVQKTDAAPESVGVRSVNVEGNFEGVHLVDIYNQVEGVYLASCQDWDLGAADGGSKEAAVRNLCEIFLPEAILWAREDNFWPQHFRTTQDEEAIDSLYVQVTIRSGIGAMLS